MWSRVKGNLNELQHFRRGVREARERVDGPITTAYNVRLSLAGVGEERRREVVDALCAKAGTEPSAPTGDGLLKMTGIHYASGQVLGVGARSTVAQFVDMLREVGMPLEEIAACPALLELTPSPGEELPAPPKNAKERLGYRIGQKGMAMRISSFDLFERDLRRSGQNTTGTVNGWIGDLDGDTDPLAQVLQAMSVHQPDMHVPDTIEESLPLTIHAQNVGSTVGALMLGLREGGDVFAAAPDGAALRLYATLDAPDSDVPETDLPDAPEGLQVLPGGKS